jgi:exonuclease SbcC
MILKSILLKNIRSYTSQQIDFPEGSILLAGDIGSGKSSVLHSIEFALFGARRDSVSGESLLRKGEKEGEVGLTFELEGHDITIRRKLKRQQDNVAQDAGSLSVDGRRIDGTATELKARMLELLGYPKELLNRPNSLVYRYTVYTPQEEMKRIIFDDNEARLDTLRKVFGIDKYKRISENAQHYVKRIKDSKKELAGIMQGLDEKKAELAKRKDELSAISKKRNIIAPLVENAREIKKKKKEEALKLEKAVEELGKLRKEIELNDTKLIEIVRQRSKNNTEVQQLDEQIMLIKKKLEAIFLEEKAYPPTEDVENDIQKLEQEMARVVSSKAELTERKKQVQLRIDELKKNMQSKSEMTSIAQQKELLYKQLLDDIKDKEMISKALADMTAKLKETETIITELSTHKKRSLNLKQQIAGLDKCPTCLQDVSTVHKQAIITQEERNISKVDSELEQLCPEKERITQMVERHNAHAQLMIESERELAKVKVELHNISTVKEELAKIMKAHTVLELEKTNILAALEKTDDATTEQYRKLIDEKKCLVRDINKYKLELKEKKHNLALLAEKEQRKEGIARHQEELKDDVRQINLRKSQLSQTIGELLPGEAAYKACKEELEKSADEEMRLEIQLSEINKETEGIQRLAQSIEKDIETKDNARKELSHLSNIQEWIEKMFVNLMHTMERQIMARVHAQFGELFSTWFSLLIEDGSISVKIDDSFMPQATQNGYDVDVEHLSGGEKTSIALAYRLALNKVINNINRIKTKDILILDEPTDGFSSEQLDKVRNVLEQLNTKQTIIVSHEAKIESFVDHVIRVHKTEHVSRVVG